MLQYKYNSNREKEKIQYRRKKNNKLPKLLALTYICKTTFNIRLLPNINKIKYFDSSRLQHSRYKT